MTEPKPLTPEVQAERDRCAAICEAVARNWDRLAASTRADGSWTVRQIWPWKLVTVVRPRFEESAKTLEAAASAMRTVKDHIERGRQVATTAERKTA